MFLLLLLLVVNYYYHHNSHYHQVTAASRELLISCAYLFVIFLCICVRAREHVRVYVWVSEWVVVCACVRAHVSLISTLVACPSAAAADLGTTAANIRKWLGASHKCSFFSSALRPRASLKQLLPLTFSYLPLPCLPNMAPGKSIRHRQFMALIYCSSSQRGRGTEASHNITISLYPPFSVT